MTRIDESFREDILQFFDSNEIDALGEIGNICMGTSATIMYTLLGRKVTITTPTVALYKIDNVLASYKNPYLAISVEFIDGLVGKNLLVLSDYDAALITDLLMGGDGVINKKEFELSEIHLSAMSEVMNQMMGSAATAMANMMDDNVNISPPQVARAEVGDSIGKFLDWESPVVKISFDMEIEGLLKTKLLQIMSIKMAKELISSLMHIGEGPEEAPAPPPPPPKPQPAAPPKQQPAPPPQPEKQHVKAVKPASYQSFDEPVPAAFAADVNTANFELINDIPLQVTVELGKARKNLNDVLNFGIGSIIVLDKQAGELVDVIVNGKRIAKGEVVIIDENYGVRITEIVKV